jgi:hypothetical protein
MDSFFTELGQIVSARWKERNFSLPDFPKIAQAALEKRPPSAQVDLAALVHDFLLDDAQPHQTQSGFGQPELVVYDDPRFYIQILFWLDGTTDIHQHEFSGAFHVLAGSSIHSQFVFEKAKSISAHVRVGDLRLTRTQLLETGRTEPIVSGRDYIHSLVHLETPSATVVVRTQNDPGTGPQFTYLPPHLAIDPVHNDALTMRRKQLLDLLETTGDPAYPELVAEMLATLDFERGFFILQNCMGHLRALGAWEEVWKVFRRKHRALAEYVAPTLDEIVRRDGLAGLRGSITDVEHRFFLALLLNVPRRAELLRFVGQRFPGKPAETIARWAEELMELSDAGTWILDAQFPEGLAVSLEEQPAVLIAGLRKLLGAKAQGTRKLSRTEEAAIREVFAGSSFRALVAG